MRRAIRDLNQGITYNEKLKRKYSSVEQESSQSSQSSLEMPENLSLDHPSSDTWDTPQEMEKEKALVKQCYASRTTKTMKWKDCWKKERDMGLQTIFDCRKSSRQPWLPCSQKESKTKSFNNIASASPLHCPLPLPH
jgi:hypothetical protein